MVSPCASSDTESSCKGCNEAFSEAPATASVVEWLCAASFGSLGGVLVSFCDSRVGCHLEIMSICVLLVRLGGPYASLGPKNPAHIQSRTTHILLLSI